MRPLPTSLALLLSALFASAPPGRCEAQGAPTPTFTPARFLPAGAAGLLRLLGEDVPDHKGVSQAVRAQGFYAGEPLGAGDCAACHADIVAQWAGSAHRFASFNNPYYAAAVDLMRQDRPPRAARFCAGCHDPLLLVTDAISAPTLRREIPAAQAGLPCLVCHSLTEAHGRLGNGNYTLTAAPVPAPAATPPAQAAGPTHRERLRNPVLSSPEFCATCHRVGLGPEITGDVWLRGQDDYTPWQSSLAGEGGVAAVYRPKGPAPSRRCQDCHMPLVPGASGKLVRSHHFPGANAALPHLRDDPDGVARTAEFLRGAVSLDLVVVQKGAPPALQERVPVPRRGTVLLDVVLRNRRVGHRFPSGTNDSNEVFIEVEARAGGGTDRVLRDSTHLVRAQPVDEKGRPLLRRDPQHMRGVVYDTSLSPSDPQVVRYLLDLDQLGGGKELPAIQVQAALRYRKFSQDYAAFACAALPRQTPADIRARCLQPPVIEIASAQRQLLPGAPQQGPQGQQGQHGSTPDAKAWERLLDHGLGLADGLVDSAAEALPSLQAARALAPERPEPLLGLCKLALALARTQEALDHCGQAERLRPDHPAALWFRAQALYRTYRWAEARPSLERALTLLPRDRNVLSMVSRVRGLTGDPQGALAAAEQILLIDPESEEGHYQRQLALRDLGQQAEADEAQARYLFHRRPVEREQALRILFRQQDPDRGDEHTPAHTHVLY
jgi:tetratricopeptide (TPR) repeat protein